MKFFETEVKRSGVSMEKAREILAEALKTSDDQLLATIKAKKVLSAGIGRVARTSSRSGIQCRAEAIKLVEREPVSRASHRVLRSSVIPKFNERCRAAGKPGSIIEPH